MDDYISILLDQLSAQRPAKLSAAFARREAEVRTASQALWESLSPAQRKLFLRYEDAQNAWESLSADAYARQTFLLARRIFR